MAVKKSRPEIIVVGAGVSGLTTALVLLRAGHSVEIWARELPQDTTSAVAAAIWYPFLAEPRQRVLGWSIESMHHFTELANNADTGVTLRDGVEVFRQSVPDPWWKDAVPNFRRATKAVLPTGYVDGYAMTLPVADMPIYLTWLESEIHQRGGHIRQVALSTLGEALEHCPTVVNCSGLGSRELAMDASMYGVRGQIRVLRSSHIQRFTIDEEAVSYVIPRKDTIVVGGTTERGLEVTIPDAHTTTAIAARCLKLQPLLADAEVLAERVGIRPCRPTVRVEQETLEQGRQVIHNYGHGGSGVTLSWGCAQEVNQLWQSSMRKPTAQ